MSVGVYIKVPKICKSKFMKICLQVPNEVVYEILLKYIDFKLKASTTSDSYMYS